MKKLLTIIGARPQIIKAAALSRAIKNSFSDVFEEKILHTGQHYDANMSQIFFDELEIPVPDYNLHVGSGSHGEQTSKMIAGIEQILLSEKYDGLVVYGDTNSTLAGAVAASKIHIPIIHIEAGLRSFNMAMPEEINRITCDQMSSILFAPTQTAVDNLMREGFMNTQVHFSNGKGRWVLNSGDIMYDNSLYFSQLADKKNDILEKYHLHSEHYVLATIHRDNNTDNPERLTAIFRALLHISEKYNQQIVLPLHPRTAKLLDKNLDKDIYKKLSSSTIQMIPPASFLEMVVLEKHAQFIMTDSGGVQKEAYYFQKPCVIFRSETEWVEIIQQGAGLIADADYDRIVEAYCSLMQKDISFPLIFGNGHAAEFMLEKILEYFN